MAVINLKQKLSLLNEYWSPKIIASMNDDKIQVAKLKGDFTWHKHELEDEMFYVISGKMFVHYRDHSDELNEGDMTVVPHGVEHMTAAPEEAHILYIAPKEEVNTGDAEKSDLTAQEATI